MDLNEAIAGAFATIITALGGLAVKYLRDYIARKAVDNALWGAAGLVVANIGRDISAVAPSVKQVALAKAADYVRDKVPDSLNSQGVNVNDLERMVLSRVGQVVAGNGA